MHGSVQFTFQQQCNGYRFKRVQSARSATGDSNDALRKEVTRRGAAGLLEKPFAISALEQLLESQTFDVIPLESTLPAIVRIPDLDEVMTGDNLRPAFQPVIVLGKPEREMFAVAPDGARNSKTPLPPHGLRACCLNAGSAIDLSS